MNCRLRATVYFFIFVNGAMQLNTKIKKSVASTVIYLVLIGLVVILFYYLNGGFARDDGYIELVDKMARVYKTGNPDTYFSIITDEAKQKLSSLYEDYESVISDSLSEQTYNYMAEYGDDLDVTYTVDSDEAYTDEQLESLRSSSEEFSKVTKARRLGVSFLLKGSKGETTLTQEIVCIKADDKWYLAG